MGLVTNAIPATRRSFAEYVTLSHSFQDLDDSYLVSNKLVSSTESFVLNHYFLVTVESVEALQT